MIPTEERREPGLLIASEAKMEAIDCLIDPVIERLTARNGGVDPQATMSIPEIVEWAGDKYGYNDPDVAELRELAEDYDYCREQLADFRDC